MKTTTMMRLMVLSLTVVLAAACGKSGGSGGSSKKSSSSSPVVLTGNAVGEAAYANLKAWYDGVDTTTPNMHAYFHRKSVSGLSVTALCGVNNVTPYCTAPSGCFKTDGSGVIKKGVVQLSTVNLLNLTTTQKYSDCNISGASAYSKSGHQDLKDAVLGTSSKVLIKGLTQQSGGVFTVYFGYSASSTSPTSYAIINATLPAIVNPIKNSSTELYTFQPL